MFPVNRTLNHMKLGPKHQDSIDSSMFSCVVHKPKAYMESGLDLGESPYSVQYVLQSPRVLLLLVLVFLGTERS